MFLMTEARRFRKRPVEVTAMVWDGTEQAFQSIFIWTGCRFRMIPRTYRVDPDITAEVWDVLHSTWVGARVGQYIIKGVRQEFYPCDPDVFASTYEAVEA